MIEKLGIFLIDLVTMLWSIGEPPPPKCPKCGKPMKYKRRLYSDQEGGRYLSDLLEPYCDDCGWPD